MRRFYHNLFAFALAWAITFFGLAVAQAQVQTQAQTGAQTGAFSTVFIQIEAQPSLAQAQRSLRSYAERFRDLNGFSLPSGWFGIALGPYPEAEAVNLLRNLRAAQLIPSDSYIVRNAALGRQFWPEGETGLPSAERTAPAQTAIAREPQPDIAPDMKPDMAPDLALDEESPRQARAAEALLTREERAEIQKALAWEGFYQGGIDAAFGPGTRRAMARWQEAQFLPATGVLTTRQRAALLSSYNAVLTGLALKPVEDGEAGIAVSLPMGLVQFDRYEAPFAHYGANDGSQTRVLLISQSGDKAALAGLYDVLQSLEIVPLDGSRSLGDADFTITGQNSKITTHIEARLEDGAIKGFALVWPAGDEARRARVLQVMQDSFTRMDAVMSADAGLPEDARIDLLAGLEIRQPKRTRSGFFIDGAGAVLTSSDVAHSCGRITLDGTVEARIEAADKEAGLTVLRPSEPLAPPRIARLASAPAPLRSEIAVAGYSFGGVLGAPSVTFGTLADVAGLAGEANLTRLALKARDSDAGGPVLDQGGDVLGMLLPPDQSDRILPEDVSFAVGLETIRRLLSDAGIAAEEASPTPDLAPEALRRQAASMTVLVSCWADS